MNRVCNSNLDKFVIVFFDDILIYLKSKDDQEVHLKIVNSNGVHVDPGKIEAVKNWKYLRRHPRYNHFLDWQSGIEDKILTAQSEASKVPLVRSVRKLIMDEAHASRYSVHPRSDKTYYDLRDMYWQPCMKKDIATYVSDCLTRSKVKAETSKTFGFIATTIYT
ncbi:putative reverse transcriptase domain-containing protein [Tanacetum coccineum]